MQMRTGARMGEYTIISIDAIRSVKEAMQKKSLQYVVTSHQRMCCIIDFMNLGDFVTVFA